MGRRHSEKAQVIYSSVDCNSNQHKNTGKCQPLKQAHLVKIVREDRVVLDPDTAGSAKGAPGYKVITDEKPAGGRSSRGMGGDFDRGERGREITQNIPYVQGGSVSEAIFKIRLYNRTSLKESALHEGAFKDKELS
jgi:hypothetical protein